MLKLGYKIAPEQFPPSEMLEQVITAEKAGFESIAASDHFHPWSEDGQSCFIWSWLGAAAARTKSIELGTGLTCHILRYNPAIIAQAAATVSAQHAGAAHPQHVAPATGARVEKQRAEPDVGRLFHPFAFVFGNGCDGELRLDAGVLRDQG